MKVKILQSISSPSYSYAAGQIVETSEERAAEFVNHGIAKNVSVPKLTKLNPFAGTTDVTPVTEETVVQPVKETTTKKAPAKKKKGDDVADNN